MRFQEYFSSMTIRAAWLLFVKIQCMLKAIFFLRDDGVQMSRPKGAQNKATITTADKLKAMGCDPLEFSANVMMGKELKGDHPASGSITTMVSMLISSIANKKDHDALKLEAEALREYILDCLVRSTTPLELRSKHATELLKYVAPQLKAIDVSAYIKEGTLHLHFDNQDKGA